MLCCRLHAPVPIHRVTSMQGTGWRRGSAERLVLQNHTRFHCFLLWSCRSFQTKDQAGSFVQLIQDGDTLPLPAWGFQSSFCGAYGSL